jgi:hypothetical protein
MCYGPLALFCPPLAKVPSGQYAPAGCSAKKQVYGTRCNISCSAGFQLKGPKSRVCGGVGKWTGQDINTCVGELQCYSLIFLEIDDSSAAMIIVIRLLHISVANRVARFIVHSIIYTYTLQTHRPRCFGQQISR